MKKFLFVLLLLTSNQIFSQSDSTSNQSDSTYYTILSDSYCYCSTTLEWISKRNNMRKEDNCFDHVLNKYIKDTGMEPPYDEYPQLSKNIVDSLFRMSMSEYFMGNLKPYLISNCTYYHKEGIMDSLLINRTDKKEINQIIRLFKKQVKSEKDMKEKSRLLIFIGILYETKNDYKKAIKCYNKSLSYNDTKFGKGLKEEVERYMK